MLNSSVKFPPGNPEKLSVGTRISIGLIFLVLLIGFSSSLLAQSISINEIMASNVSIITDEDGDYEDWIELFNHGTEPVNLEGFGLSDDPLEPFKWTFPNITIEAGEYLLVWASGKDRRPSDQEDNYVNGIKRDVFSNIPGSGISDLTNHPSYPGSPDSESYLTSLFEAPINIADDYGQRVYGLLRAPQTGSYTFWIASDDNSRLYLSTTPDATDKELIASVPGWTNSRNWDKYPEQMSATITLTEGQDYYVEAIMKEGYGGDNLAVGWQLPDNSLQRPISAEHLFRLSSQLHSNFRISSSGEPLLLSDPNGNLIDELPPVSLPTDISYGRSPNGTGEWFLYITPTPGSSNNTEAFTEILDAPAFSVAGGFHSGEITLTLSHPDSETQIIYTLDGSEPRSDHIGGVTYSYKNSYPFRPGDPFGDTLYNTIQTYNYIEPVTLTDRSAEPDKLTQISTTHELDPWYQPNSPVKKGTVVKARAVKPGALPSDIVTQSYFFSPNGINPYNFPVISLSISEDELFDYYKGIYVAGEEFDQWRIRNPSSDPNGGTDANYHIRTDEYERVAYFEYYEVDASLPVLSQNLGIQIHGAFSRSNPLKSLRLCPRNEHGTSTMDYPFFTDKPYDSYKRIILRNSGNDFWHTYFRDAVIHKISLHMDMGTQAYQPSAMFLNGEYWGIHNMRERYDKHYLEQTYGIDPENIDLLSGNASIDEGTAEHFVALRNFIQNNDLGNSANYDYIKTQMDIDNFIDYQIVNIYAANTDWPGNNIKYWRLQTDQYIADAPYGHDGRWRWLLLDTDFGFDLYGHQTHNTLAFATTPNGPSWPNPAWSTLFLRKLLENESFKLRFINRFADMLNTAYLPERVNQIINDTKDLIQPHMQEQIHRWKTPGGSMNAWDSNINKMISFANQRPSNQRAHIRSQFNISYQVTLTADINIAGAGKIRVNTITIDPETPGIEPDPYPWQGLYFNGVPIEIEAIPAQGYTFSRWEGANNSSEPVITITPSTIINLKAHFVQVEESVLVHYWHFNALNGDVTEVPSDYSATHTPLITYPGTGDGYMDERTHRIEDPVSNLNLQMDQQPNQGAVLRVRNPSDTRELIIDAPTAGFRNPQFAYATTSTSNGATSQILLYSTNGGTSWTEALPAYEITQLPVWELKTFDLTAIDAADNNPDLKFKVVFGGENASLTAGNNRFDNITLFGEPLTSAVEAQQPLTRSLIIYPNPAQDSFTVKSDVSLSNNATLQIIALDGRVVTEVEVPEPEFSISTQSFPEGVYILKMITEKGIFTGRLVKQ